MLIAFLLYEGMTALDLVGPHEILSRLPGAKVKRVAKAAGSIMTDSGMEIVAEYSLKDVESASVLVIPGSGSANSFRNDPEVLDWVRSIHNTTSWTASVCTGSLILGAAGILTGLKATTHWAAMDRLKEWGAKPEFERIVQDGKVMTAAGVSAGIDMALTLSANIAGQRFAEGLQLGIEYDPQPPFHVGSPSKAAPAVVDALRIKFAADFEK